MQETRSSPQAGKELAKIRTLTTSPSVLRKSLREGEDERQMKDNDNCHLQGQGKDR